MIAGYHIYYLKSGKPIMGYDDSILEIPLVLKSILIPPELIDSAKELIAKNGNTVLSEDVITKWCAEVGLEERNCAD